MAITYLVEDFTGGSADTDGEISLALDRVLDHLAETAGSALEKARKGEDWQEEVDRVGSHEMIASGAD